MREFRIKVNNEKTYVVKAKDYNQAVKTLHSKLRDFDDTKKNINVVREFITNNGGKFSKSKDADAILDFIYKKTGVKNADYGDVLYIVRNYTNVKVEDNTITDYDLTNFLALKRSLELRIGEEIDFDKLEEYVNKLPKDKNGKKNVDVKEVIKCCIKAKDNAVSDSISKYNGEDAIRTNGFVRIKEDGEWTSYKYNGSSDFDDAVFKIHQYNPSLIAFVSHGNKTITVRNKYLNDSADTAQGEIEVLKSFGFDYKDGRWVKESNSNDIIVQPDYHSVSVIGPGDTEKHCKKYQYQSAGMLKKIIASNIKDSSIKDFGNFKTFAEVEKYLNSKGYKIDSADKPLPGQRLKEKYITAYKNGKQKYIELFQYSNGDYEIMTSLSDSSISDKLIESGSKEALSKNIATEIKSGKDPKQAAAIAYSVQRENDASTGYKFRITNNGSKWYYETTFPDGHTTLTGPYLSRQETEQYFHKHRPTEKLTDAEPVKVEKIIRKEKSALGITYYIFQTKSSSGATIYYEVTDKTYHGEPTYSGGGVISFSLQSANDSLDSHLLSDKLKAKYGEKEGTKRYLRGENDSAIHDMAETDMSMLQKATRVPAHNIYHNRISYDDLKRTINKVMEEGNDKDVVNILIGQLAELKKDYETDINNSKLDKEETKRHYNEYKRLVNNYKNSQISKEYTRAVNNFLSAIKDSNNIKNRKSYTIKVGDKQYKVFAESESEAIDKYIKSKKQ